MGNTTVTAEISKFNQIAIPRHVSKDFPSPVRLAEDCRFPKRTRTVRVEQPIRLKKVPGTWARPMTYTKKTGTTADTGRSTQPDGI